MSESQRLAHFEQQADALKAQHYTEERCTVDLKQKVLPMFASAVPLALCSYVLFLLLVPVAHIGFDLGSQLLLLLLGASGPTIMGMVFVIDLILPGTFFGISLQMQGALLLCSVASVFIHELLHAFGWLLFVRDPKKISFGFVWETKTPYCCCSKALPSMQYAVGLLMPLLGLGGGLLVVAIITENFFFLVLSVANIIYACGDVYVFTRLIKRTKAIIMDHPSECGFVAYEKG